MSIRNQYYVLPLFLVYFLENSYLTTGQIQGEKITKIQETDNSITVITSPPKNTDLKGTVELYFWDFVEPTGIKIYEDVGNQGKYLIPGLKKNKYYGIEFRSKLLSSVEYVNVEHILAKTGTGSKQDDLGTASVQSKPEFVQLDWVITPQDRIQTIGTADLTCKVGNVSRKIHFNQNSTKGQMQLPFPKVSTEVLSDSWDDAGARVITIAKDGGDCSKVCWKPWLSPETDDIKFEGPEECSPVETKHTISKPVPAIGHVTAYPDHVILNMSTTPADYLIKSYGELESLNGQTPTQKNINIANGGKIQLPQPNTWYLLNVKHTVYKPINATYDDVIVFKTTQPGEDPTVWPTSTRSVHNISGEDARKKFLISKYGVFSANFDGLTSGQNASSSESSTIQLQSQLRNDADVGVEMLGNCSLDPSDIWLTGEKPDLPVMLNETVSGGCQEFCLNVKIRLHRPKEQPIMDLGKECYKITPEFLRDQMNNTGNSILSLVIRFSWFIITLSVVVILS